MGHQALTPTARAASHTQRFGDSIAKGKVTVGQGDGNELGVGWREEGVSGSPKSYVG